MSGSVGDQAEDLAGLELGAAAQERKLDQERAGDDLAPVDVTRSRQARIVPPVARTSSIKSTRWPGPKASLWTSSLSLPYSS